MAAKVILIVLAVVGALLLLLLVLLKVAVRIGKSLGWSGACPVGLNWILDNPVRRRYAPSILDRVGIRTGERVLELGPGPGVFSLDAARRTGPTGRLICTDIQAGMIARVAARAREARLDNIEARVASAYELPLENESVDRAFLVSVLSEIPDQERALRELLRVLKPAGILSVTEEFPDPDYLFPNETIRRLQSIGFRLESRFGSLWRYTLNFRRTLGHLAS